MKILIGMTGFALGIIGAFVIDYNYPAALVIGLTGGVLNNYALNK